jgi:hypothetical protein
VDWKPTHLTSVFSLRTSVLLLPDGTMLTAFADVNMDVRQVGFLTPKKGFYNPGANVTTLPFSFNLQMGPIN